MNLPAMTFEYFLPQSITVPRGSPRVIRSAVTLNARQERALLFRMYNTQVDEEASDADLWNNFEIFFLEYGANRTLEIVRHRRASEAGTGAGLRARR
jgi:hypothetical protein